MESGPPHLKCTTLILSALPLPSLFAWKPPHDVAGINSSNFGGHSNAGVRTPSTKLAPLAPELCSDTKYSEIIFHDACVVRILALLDDVIHYCVTSEVEDYFRKWYDGFRSTVISADLSLNLAQEFIARSLCAVRWDLRGTEAAKRVWVWTIEYDCNVFYFIFTFSFATYLREFTFVAHGRRRRR